MKKALVVGGSNGIGLSIVMQLKNENYEKIYIVDRVSPVEDLGSDVEFKKFNLLENDYSIFDKFGYIDTLIITAGFGRVVPFEQLKDQEIINNFKVNTLAVIKIIKKFYSKISEEKEFNCAVMGSIAGLISSPLFSIYGSSKAALCKFIESINIELEMKGTKNRILNVSPGSIKGTSFNGGKTNLNETSKLAREIIIRMHNRETLFIPEYEETFKSVIERYNDNPRKFGIESYEYKFNNNRINDKPQLKVGYLSGTFDLFHIGHLNLLRKAKDVCDYLVVGVHRDASHKNKETFIPFEERMEIVKNIKYVDEVIQSLPEDSDAYDLINYDFLFVGSDYKGTEKFNRYEEYFSDKNVEIIYFPYTNGTSSTELRSVIENSVSQNVIHSEECKSCKVDDRDLILDL